jgi:23S rRNA (uracil1939-C5)-methyltransferase
VTEEFDVQIDSIAAGGDGVGRHNGLVVFVPRTAPRDVAKIAAVKQDRLMRGELRSLVSSSPLRTTPLCDHYTVDRCGGCQLQHMDYSAQLQAKAGIIRDTMTRIGRRDVEPPPVAPSDLQWRYRSKLTLALRRANGEWIAGLRRYDAPDEIFPLRDCPITDERVLKFWKSVLAHAPHLPGASQLRASLRLIDGGFAFTVEGGESWMSSAALFESIPEMLELWWQPQDQGRRLQHSRRATDRTGASFAQVNAAVARRLLERVLELSRQSNPRTAIDAYAGSGELAVRLAEQGARVTAIEIDREAARLCSSRLPKGSRAIAAAVERALPDALPADLVVLNPPRAGLHARVTELLEAQNPKPRSLIYVSCNPATLARDVKRLDSYQVRSLQGFDMFPQTAHVETVCELVPAA